MFFADVDHALRAVQLCIIAMNHAVQLSVKQVHHALHAVQLCIIDVDRALHAVQLNGKDVLCSFAS